MEKHHQLAWDCLTELEQQCLYLNLGQGLSTWRAGEILKVTHYKYLELKARAEKLFKLFSDYFEKAKLAIDEMVEHDIANAEHADITVRFDYRGKQHGLLPK